MIPGGGVGPALHGAGHFSPSQCLFGGILIEHAQQKHNWRMRANEQILRVDVLVGYIVDRIPHLSEEQLGWLGLQIEALQSEMCKERKRRTPGLSASNVVQLRKQLKQDSP
ncbi:MAG: hypothetical protein OEU36_19560 [Gammaproteobacteria bacterium]|nr:hypothetical protein [Gammaproteobacteria bacterium]